MERANEEHVLAQSRGRSLCAVASTPGRWSSSMVTSLCWRSAIVVLSQSLTPVQVCTGVLLGRRRTSWSTVRIQQRAFGGTPCLFWCDWSLRWLDVCICVWIHRKRVSRSRFVKDAASWRRKWVAVREGSVRPRSRAQVRRSGGRFCILKFRRRRDVAYSAGESRGLPGGLLDPSAW